MRVRRACAEDLRSIFILEKEAFPTGWSDEAWTQENEGHFVAVAALDEVGDTAGNQVLGVIAMSVVAETAEVRRIIVAKTARHQGLGRALLDYGCLWAREKGATEVFLEVSTHNDSATRLYVESGFSRIDSRKDYYGVGEDAVIYRRDLSEEDTCQNH